MWGIDGQYDFVRACSTTATATCPACLRTAPASASTTATPTGTRAPAPARLRAERDRPVRDADRGYTLLNADLAYTYRRDGSGVIPEVTIGIKGENLLDDDVRNSVSFKKDEVLLQGQNVRLYQPSSN